MRLAVFHDLPSGGAKRALHQQVKGLVSLGHTVDVFVPSTAEERFLPLQSVASSVTTFSRPQPPNRERVLEGRTSPLDPLHWLRYLALVRRSEREIAQVIDERGYELALVHPTQFTQAPWILRFLRTPSLYWCHEPLRSAHEPRVTSLLVRFGTRQLLGRIDGANTRAATYMAVNSHFTQSRVETIYGRQAEINYLGVDTQRFRPLSVGRNDFVLTVAALHPQKGLDFLVQALAAIPEKIRPPLLVTSDRSRAAERHRLECQAKKMNVRIDFRFRVGEEELVQLYNRARLVVYAPYNEPFGFVPLEAMACGRPVLGVREGGIPETVVEGETGFLADRNPDRFAARIIELITNPENAERVGSRARDIVRERWTWERSVAELAALCAGTAACE